MHTLLMPGQGSVGSQGQVTHIALVGETVGEMFTFYMIPHFTKTSFSKLSTNCTTVTLLNIFLNVFVKIFIRRDST